MPLIALLPVGGSVSTWTFAQPSYACFDCDVCEVTEAALHDDVAGVVDDVEVVTASTLEVVDTQRRHRGDRRPHHPGACRPITAAEHVVTLVPMMRFCKALPVPLMSPAPEVA